MADASAIRLLADPVSQICVTGLARFRRLMFEAWPTVLMMDRAEKPRASVADATAENVEDVRDIAATRAGDGEAYRRLVRRYQDVIAQQMRRFSRHPQVCEDLVHDVFVEAYLGLKSYRGSAPWLHWLRKIAVRTGYRFWSRQQANGDIVTLSADDWRKLRGPDTPLGAEAEAAELVFALLSRLAPNDRLILTLLYLDECSIAEAASRAGWTVTGAKLRAFRARNKLKDMIERGDS